MGVIPRIILSLNGEIDMGYKVENYNINELHRIAIPGRVPPCLFWAIPVGAWRQSELEELWVSFTEGNEKCRQLGLFLLKQTPDYYANRQDKNYVDLAKISDLLPVNLKRVHREFESHRLNVRRVLIITGSYPQPGWGLLLDFEEWRQDFNHTIEESFNEVEMRNAITSEMLQTLSEAIREYHNVSNRRVFHHLINEAVELQWKLGPKFLVALEKRCIRHGIKVTNIPWDPARMIGWKIHASGITINSNDLAVIAQELAPNAMSDMPEHENIADGSYFTDYVHHIAISRARFSPRTVTYELLKSLLRPNEINELINKFSETPSALGTDRTILVESLLNKLGWQRSEKDKEQPLAACIKLEAENLYVLIDEIDGNQLRIILESFCKDVIDVIIAQLGYGNDEIWRVINETKPDYRARESTKDWNKEVKSMTVGSAIILLGIFGPLAITDDIKSNAIKNLIKYLYRLSEILNNASHHNDEGSIAVKDNPEIPMLINQVIETTKVAIGDLPWHMETSFVYGEQPKVISGEAWSHGHSLPRLLRAILWAGDPVDSQVMLWNKSRINPVIPDPFFIRRPGRD